MPEDNSAPGYRVRSRLQIALVQTWCYENLSKRRLRGMDTYKEDDDGHGYPFAEPVDAPSVETLACKRN
jgi:hypothetical protein